jgi:amino acid adenylation domain-containing protein/non-ribosomal peptide synthase protein (TIGR01720 family)
MQHNTQLEMVQRFVQLPLAQRRLFLEKLAAKGMSLAQFPLGPLRSGEGPWPVSYAQERQWFLWQLEPQSTAYHMPTVLRLSGALDVAALQRALDALIVRHEALRTVFIETDDGLRQQVLPAVSLPVRTEALCGELDAAIEAEVAQPFDLRHGPLLRLALLQEGPERHVLVLTLHHIVSDAWSMQRLVAELVQLYAGQGELPALPIQYADYALWQRSWMEAGERDRQLGYWREALSGEQPLLELPFDRARPARQSHCGERVELHLPAAAAQALHTLAKTTASTPFVILLAAFQATLHRYSGQADIRVGVPIANRTRLETQGLIGFFVNTQVLRAELDGQLTFNEVLDQVRARTQAAQAHQELPFEQLVDALQPERSLSHSPLFQVMFNHQSGGRSGQGLAGLPGLSVQSLERTTRTSHFDLVLDTWDGAEGIHAAFTFATDLFERATIERFGQHWAHLLEAALADPAQRLCELPLMTPGDTTAQIAQWNRGAVARPSSLLVHQLFEAQAQQAPDAPAILFGEQVLSYAEVNRRANRLAHALISRGIGAESRVAILLPRSAEVLVSFLAVHKAGAAYVPLDVAYPQDRLQYMVQDSRAALIVTDRIRIAELALDETRALALDDVGLASYAETNPQLAICEESLAYVIYTSGSTGLPKGVAVPFGALSMHIQAAGARYQTSPADCMLHFMSFAFDGSHEGWMHPLINGGRVLVRDDEIWSPEHTYEQMKRHGVTIGIFPPVYIQQLAEHAEHDGQPPAVRIYCAGGDAVSQASYDLVRRALRPDWFINGYGPTETVVTPLLWKAGHDEPCPGAYAPIGDLVGSRSAYVLDDHLALQPVGLSGELYLGGQGVARGYLDRAALTAERFVPDPFGGGGGRLYRSGDLTRYTAGGVVEYQGRVDHQVKVRGFRIELGEIEARLLELDAVSEAVVVAQDTGNGKRLVAYVVAVGEGQALVESVRAQLRQQLPEYMIPAHFVVLTAMPLTPNGKLDRKALPAPDLSVTPRSFVAPVTTLEQRLAEIWQQVLKLDRVGLYDNFFELGGDSIISLQMVSRARREGIALAAKDVFEHQTVQGLASVAREVASTVAEQAPVTGAAPLTPIQQAFFERAVAQPHHWNQSLVLTPREALQPEPLARALATLVAHHDALRLRFTEQQGQWQADYAGIDDAPLLKTFQAADADAFTACADGVQRSLDLAHGPLLQAVLADWADGSQRLLLVIHHLAVDGVSWRVLLEDLEQAYAAALRGETAVLAAKTHAFKGWAERLQALAVAKTPELGFWQQQLSGGEDRLPGQREGTGLLGNSRSVRSRLSEAMTRKLLQQAPAAYRTQINDLLLSALARVLCDWTGRDEVLVRLEGHGREALFEDVDLSRTVGWFTALYPVRLTPAAEYGASIKAIKEQLRAVPDKGVGYGLLRYLGQPETRSTLAALPEGAVLFNYLGQFDQSFDAEQGWLRPARESAGTSQSPEAALDTPLSINGQVYGGVLELGFSFDDQVLDTAAVEALAERYTQVLEAMIEHCCQASAGALTPSDVPLAHLDQARLDALPLAPSLVEDIYPLAPLQQGMLFHALYGAGNGDYVNQMRVDVQGLDVAAFRAAWQAVVQQHETLRANFLADAEPPLQVIRRTVEVPCLELDWRNVQCTAETLAAWAAEDRLAGFDLLHDPLLRLALLRTGEDSHHLVMTSHHIMLDGWSLSQMLAEVLQRYAGQPVHRGPGRYRDYIAWLQRQDVSRSEQFWRGQLAPVNEPTRLARCVGTVAAVGGYGQHGVVLDAARTRVLADFARRQRVTLNTLVQAAWALLLQRYTGQASVAFGATVAGRPAELPGIEQQLGLFINTLPVIATPDATASVGQWLSQLQGTNLALREHEHTPLYDVQRWAGFAGEALFDSVLVFENYPVAEALQQGPITGLRFGEVASQEQTHYPLTLVVGVHDQLSFQFSHALGHFDAPAIARIAAHFVRLLEALAQDAANAVGNLPIFAAHEHTALLADWNPVLADYPSQACLHQLIEAQAARHPHATALVFEGQHLSYGELNRRANRIAHHLRQLGVGPDVLVGLAVERSLEMVVGLVAILKAGGAYLPLDPDSPGDRLAYIIDDADLTLLLAQQHLRAVLSVPPNVQCLALETAGEGCPEHNPVNLTTAANLAYVIYTSGSTGKPKGTLLPHHNVLRLFEATARDFAFDESDVWTLFHSYAFDFSVWEIFGALLYGGRLVIVPRAVTRSPEDFHKLLAAEQVTVLNQTPSAFKQLMPVACASDKGLALRHVVFGGEALEIASLAPWFERFGDQAPRLINMYGITETTVHVTFRPVTLADLGSQAVSPIGRAIDDLSWYVLDGALNPVALGCTGELHVGRAGLARGYLGRPALTAERFIPDPFAGDGGRLYRTGDLANAGLDGAVEYIGRIDHQVKIRGFRIELGEIAAQLHQHPLVREAAVVDVDGPLGKQLVGYLVPKDTSADPREVLKAHLKTVLPDYMVPAHLVLVERLPLTTNGKLDRKALPAPEVEQQAYVAPVGEIEQQVAAIWADVLKVEQVGRDDDFFELGGHSLLSLTVISRLQLQLGLTVKPELIFQFPKLAEFAEALNVREEDSFEEKLRRLSFLAEDLESVE